MVKYKIAWQHEAILGEQLGQLTLMQLVQGFTQNILDENDSGKCKHMLA